MAGIDVVEQQGHRPLLSRRGGQVALVLVVVVALSAGVADWQVRRHEGVRVDRCVEAALGAVSQSRGRVAAMAGYVGPSLASLRSEALRSQIFQLISQTALPGRRPVRRARALCDAVSVLPTHTALRRTRADCVRMLAAELRYLAAVAEDGRHPFVATGPRLGRCVNR
jgi:hypothetical protein